MASVTKNAIRTGFLNSKGTVFFLCDIQERFRPLISYFDEIANGAARLAKVSKIMDIPLIVTEQNPAALGATASEIDKSHALGTHGKTKFSMCVPEVVKHLDSMKDLSSVVLFGIEAHICVEQTAMELRQRGLDVHVVGDSTSSRSMEDRLLAFERLRQMGCYITSSENVIFKLMLDKNHPKFNEIKNLVKTATPLTGLAKL